MGQRFYDLALPQYIPIMELGASLLPAPGLFIPFLQKEEENDLPTDFGCWIYR